MYVYVLCVCFCYVFVVFIAGNNGGMEDMYTELWKACAGPLVDIPRNGERVYYFPQGHMEQVSCKVQIFLFLVVLFL